MDEQGGWDLTDFVNKYTAKSTMFSSPRGTTTRNNNDESALNHSLQSEGVPLDSGSFQAEEDAAFCTKDNVQERLNFLNQELGLYGFQSLFSHKPNSNQHDRTVEDLELHSLVTCTYELLRRQHLQAKAKDDLEVKHLRSESDNEYLIQSQVRLKQDVENLRRESALLLCREKEQIDKCRILAQEVKTEREEKRKLKSDVEHLKKQFYHESKRTEKEISRLKEKIHLLLNDKSMEKKFGMNVLNSLQRADGKRNTWKTTGKKNDDEMYKMIISNYEDKEKKLLTENQALRETLSEVRNQLLSVDNSIGSSEMAEEEARQLQMPFFMVKSDVENQFYQMISNLKERLDLSPQKEPSPVKENDSSFTSNTTSENFRQKLEQCKAVITGQEVIIQELKDGYSKEAFERALLTFGISEENYMESESRSKKLREEEVKLQEERKNFGDYVLKVSKEREEFEKERVEFYMHCLSTPVMNKDTKLHPRGLSKHALRIATPSFSPAPSSMLSSKKENINKSSKTPPSTADLYRYMSLNYDGVNGTRNAERNLNGSFVQAGNTSPNDCSPSPKKLHEHAENVRRAVEQRHHNRSIEEKQTSPRANKPSAGGFTENTTFYMME